MMIKTIQKTFYQTSDESEFDNPHAAEEHERMYRVARQLARDGSISSADARDAAAVIVATPKLFADLLLAPITFEPVKPLERQMVGPSTGIMPQREKYPDLKPRVEPAPEKPECVKPPTRTAPCAECTGTGWIGGQGGDTCGRCGGSGRVPVRG